ncbi:7328_t:CDS:2 [Funneliformis caledonium]|uniref:7328_t:CDS:1 n=1 Tax=Funneliformis caledonium TaxID=1117310 RepID=A0A9N8WQ91_9GLOM|nr:7328_t:CDS:2 [Funneliformis caledonium]
MFTGLSTTTIVVCLLEGTALSIVLLVLNGVGTTIGVVAFTTGVGVGVISDVMLIEVKDGEIGGLEGAIIGSKKPLLTFRDSKAVALLMIVIII